MSDINEVKQTLESHLRLGELSDPNATLVYVNHRDFETKFRPYTTKGSMVFLERQDEKKSDH
ncbi:hypothetical protein IPJ72_03205 [Candidatus Peregrinibacteria bacterium]|nr:MAG: hypothetical protein IPJ72_03205 [Candidatus Peregrinibacteria bacterium]